MNIGLWIVQGLLAFAYVAAGLFKISTPRLKLAEKGMGWTKDFSDTQVKLIGLAELVGAVGLVAPWASGIAPVLTPVAASCLVVIMGGALATHLRRKETVVPPLILGLLSLAVALGRFGLLG
jgi:DoxX-like family